MMIDCDKVRRRDAGLGENNGLESADEVALGMRAGGMPPTNRRLLWLQLVRKWWYRNGPHARRKRRSQVK